MKVKNVGYEWYSTQCDTCDLHTNYTEHRRQSDQMSGPMFIPWHHWKISVYYDCFRGHEWFEFRQFLINFYNFRSYLQVKQRWYSYSVSVYVCNDTKFIQVQNQWAFSLMRKCALEIFARSLTTSSKFLYLKFIEQ